MADLKAVVFDADGTLLNSFELIYSAYCHVAQTHNLRVPSAEEIRSQMGNPLPDIFKSLYPDIDIDTLLDTNSSFVAANSMKSEAFEGVEELLDDLHNCGLKLAILTSGGPKIVDVLKHHEIDHCFASIVHHERISNPKPDAEGFLLATKECGVIPNEAMMVGDTIIDIQTGKNGSAFATVAVTHGFGRQEDLEQSQPTHLVNDLPSIMPIISSYMKS